MILTLVSPKYISTTYKNYWVKSLYLSDFQISGFYILKKAL